MKRLCFFALLMFFVTACTPSVSYRAVTPDTQLQFPRDHFAHDGFRTEWWYYTGHLEAEDGRTYGFELVFFSRRTEGDWRYCLPVWWFANPANVAHFAISDLSEGKFVYGESLGLRDPYRGGASENRYHLWSEDWQAVALDGVHYLSAAHDGYAIDLALTSRKPPALHGENGYSFKGEGGSAASYYYSLTRLAVSGWLLKDGQRLRVTGGSAWMDHEVVSGAISPDIAGWDWFSLQLDDNTEIMFFLLRRPGGDAAPDSSGTFVFADGSTVHLKKDEVQVEELAHWTSPRTHTRYPVAWRMRLPGRDLDLTLRAPLPHSELLMSATDVNYWEGAVEIEGTRGSEKITGRGYVEMSGRDRPFQEI
ncbi:MAG TPA: lipocalin-like domain-containing protein [bacterium]|mgnify:FL=1|nr:lipocalin-like domain-containing protein [bacterium]